MVQVGEGADENFLGYWWCEHYRQKYEIGLSTGAARRARGGSAVRAAPRPPTPRRSAAKTSRSAQRAERGQELFWGGAVCWWGEMRERLTPEPRRRSRRPIDCPVEGLLPDSRTHARQPRGGRALPRRRSTGSSREPEVLQKIPYMEMKLRLPEHLLMRVDKLTMAHAIEARVPFLDHDVVEFATRLPPSYKLQDGVGKHAAEEGRRAVSRRRHDLPPQAGVRRADGGVVPRRRLRRPLPGGVRAIASCRKEGFFDDDYFSGLAARRRWPAAAATASSSGRS